MAFSGTKVEKQGDRERGQRPTKLLVDCRRQKWDHMPSRVGAWEMPSERNDALGDVSLTF